MIYIVTGQVHSGKTSAISKCINPSTWGGVLCPIVEGKKILQNIHTGLQIDFEVKSAYQGIICVGKYQFLESSFLLASTWTLQHICNMNIKYILIDEIGKLEMNNQGFHNLLSEIKDDMKGKHLVLIVRDYLLEEVIKKYNLKNYHTLLCNDFTTNLQSFFE